MSFYVQHNSCELIAELIADHCKKGPLSMFFFVVYININIFKCIQIALNTQSFMHIILVKKKQSVKQWNRPISGQIR